jgi:F0F1-type ATP synthase membrane subunit b/b'
MIQAKTLESGFTPSGLSIQRGIGDFVSNGWNKTKDFVGAGLGKGRDLLTGGLDWVKNNIIRPLTSLASSGWNAVKGFGSQIGNAFQQANPTIWDVFQPEHLMFRMASNQRKQLFAQAIQAERSQRAQAAAGIQSSGAAPVTEPSQLQRLNGLAETIESGAGKVFDIKKEILEGAVVGDFNENPTIWNTIGQVAIGFVPYAGQVADIRDIVANVKKLHETGYKDPDAWINLGLTAIGIIPGFGDAIKAAGKGSKGAIRKGLSSVLKNADNILRPVLGKAKGMLNGAGRYGKQFLGWASGQGAKLLQGVKGFGQKTVNFAASAGQRARGLVTALNSRIGGFVNGAMQRARNVANQGRGLLGKVMGPFTGMATKAFDAVKSRVSQAVNMVKTAAQRGKDVALKVGSKIADTTRKAGNLLKDFTQSAIQKGRQALQTAKQWSSQQIKRATELGSRWVTQARKRVADLVSNGVKLAKEKAIPFIKQKLGGVKHRIKDFLQDKWNKLKEKLGIKKPEQPTGKTGEPKGKPVPEDLKKLVSDEAQLQRLLGKTDDAEQLKRLLSAVGNDATKLETLLNKVGDAKKLEKLLGEFTNGDELLNVINKLGNSKDFAKLVDDFGADGLKKLVDDFGSDGLKKLVDSYGADGLKELMIKAGNEADKFRTIKNKTDVPAHYSSDPRFDSLSADPAEGGKIKDKGLREAMAGLETEAQGKIKKPIERGPAEIEFYDADGIPYDVKTPPSPQTGARFSFNAQQSGDSILKQLRKQFPNQHTGKLEPITVILDATYLTEKDYKALWQYIQQNATVDELKRIITINVRF